MRQLMAFMLVLLTAVPRMVWAGPTPAPTPVTSHTKRKKKKDALPQSKFTPINVQAYSYPYYDADSGWSQATAISYSHDGAVLTEPKDFEKAITPLNDPEANQFLRSAADKDNWGQGLLWGGAAVEAAGWTDFTVEMISMGTYRDSSGRWVDHVPNMIPSTVMILGGVGLILKGVFTQFDAGGDRASAVDRYNSVVQSGQNLSLMVLPDRQAVGLGFSQAF